jgi:mRNA interferase MazF
MAAESEGTSRSALLRRGAAVLEAAEQLEADRELRAAYRRVPQGPGARLLGTTARRRNCPRLVARGDITWPDLGPLAGRRPMCVLTRDAAIEVLTALSCAPITRTIRGIRSEVEVGRSEGLPETSVISLRSLDQALRYALDIQY